MPNNNKNVSNFIVHMMNTIKTADRTCLSFYLILVNLNINESLPSEKCHRHGFLTHHSPDTMLRWSCLTYPSSQLTLSDTKKSNSCKISSNLLVADLAHCARQECCGSRGLLASDAHGKNAAAVALPAWRRLCTLSPAWML